MSLVRGAGVKSVSAPVSRECEVNASSGGRDGRGKGLQWVCGRRVYARRARWAVRLRRGRGVVGRRGDDLHVRAASPHLIRQVCIPAPAEQVLARRQVLWNLDLVHQVPVLGAVLVGAIVADVAGPERRGEPLLGLGATKADDGIPGTLPLLSGRHLPFAGNGC